MTDRFRYLPCYLDDALSCPDWAEVDEDRNNPDVPPTAPFVLHYTGPKGIDDDLDEDDVISGRSGDHIDLAHPAGWDHAVRALAEIHVNSPWHKQEGPPESCSVRFEPISDGHAWGVYWNRAGITESFTSCMACSEEDGDVYVAGLREKFHTSAKARREALARCICTALGVDPDTVFP